MIISADMHLARKCKIEDAFGNEIRYVCSFDTETKEAELYVNNSHDGGLVQIKLPGSSHRDALMAKVILHGCRAINKETGEEIK